jgi:hypothetical protein
MLQADQATMTLQGTLSLQQVNADSSIGTIALTTSGNLNIGSNNLNVSTAYTNANWSQENGNTFNPLADISTSGGKIIGANASLIAVGDDIVSEGGGNYIVQFHNSQSGGAQASFSLQAGSEAITYGVNTNSLNGFAIASNLNANNGIINLQPNGTSASYNLTLNGNLPAGQSVKITSNFSNVTPITITFEAPPSIDVTSTLLNDPGEAQAGEVLSYSLTMSGPVTVDTSGGTPELLLDDGAVATYNATNSDPGSGMLVFDYTVGDGDHTPDLEVTGVDLNGGLITDADGNIPDFSGAYNQVSGLQIGNTYVTGVTPSLTGGIDANQTVQLDISLSEAVAVDTQGGSPILNLNDNAFATYDSAASNPGAGTLVFDYTAGAQDATPDLTITDFDLNGATMDDPNGIAVDTSGLDGAQTGLRVGLAALTVTAVTPAVTGVLDSGGTELTLTMSAAVGVDESGGGAPAISHCTTPTPRQNLAIPPSLYSTSAFRRANMRPTLRSQASI